MIVPIALELLKSDIGPKRWNAVGILGMVYEKRQINHLSEQAAQRIKQTMIGISTNDKESVTRTTAVSILGKIGTTADIPLLENIAKSDSATYKRGEKLRYPVREAAAEAITAIRSRNRER